MLVSIVAARLTGQGFDPALLQRMARLLAIFVLVVLYFTAVKHLSNMYVAQHWAVEKFILLNGGIYTELFWFGQIIFGSLIPLAILFLPSVREKLLVPALVLVILGGFAQLYVIVIGGQAFPLEMFPGMIVSSGFYDGEIAGYAPSIYELGLGVGGVSLALIITGLAVKILRILPQPKPE